MVGPNSGSVPNEGFMLGLDLSLVCGARCVPWSRLLIFAVKFEIVDITNPSAV